MEAHAIPLEKPFSHSEQVFAALVCELESPALAEQPHGDIERLIREKGGELLRVLFEDHLNPRGEAGPSELVVVGSDGVARTHRRDMPCKLMSIFGVIELRSRTGWRGRGAPTLCPLDATLNLPVKLASHGVRRRIAELAGKCSFDDVGDELVRSTGATAGKRQIEEITRDVSGDVDEFYKASSAEVVDDSATILVGGIDATGITMRPEALREATRRQYEADRQAEAELGVPWPKAKRKRDARRNGMRMATVSVVYEVAPHARTAQDILRDLRPVDVVHTKAPRPRPQAKLVSASVIKSVPVIVRELFDEMQRRDPGHRKRWVILLDGNEHQIECIEAESRRRGIAVTIVLDFIHVAQ